MKKLIILILLISPLIVLADTQTVTLVRCVDGDTAVFNYQKEEASFRFLAIDTPELKGSSRKREAYSKEAANYTCKALQEAQVIKVEFDSNSDRQDRYGRYLAWIYVDNSLLQEELVSKGYAKVAYLYGDYAHTGILEKQQTEAQKHKRGLWKSEPEKFIDKILGIISDFFEDLKAMIDKFLNDIADDIKKQLL